MKRRALMCMCVSAQELNSGNYLELYRVADLFHLPVLEEAVVAFLVEHLSELSQSRQDEALQLPYRLLQEVLKSDRLTSLSEEEIWKVTCRLPSVCFPLHGAGSVSRRSSAAWCGDTLMKYKVKSTRPSAVNLATSI